PGWNYEQFFYKEFLPHIESMYRVIGNKQNRAVAGLSMGGGGSTAYGQRHPELFGSVYAMSALMDLPENRNNQTDQNSQTKRALLTKSVIENSCVDYVINATEEQKEALRSIRWFVDCGDDDFLLDSNIDFFRAMRNAKIPLEFRIRDGAHDWLYWQSALLDCLPFVSQSFQR
ncbi:alpha/beta hydrolase-fold protein, partial [Brucella sp. 21LCYQ03]|nr:alpha/beta hydrolase-fold protein [Brucella sp. 21LCYQ03]